MSQVHRSRSGYKFPNSVTVRAYPATEYPELLRTPASPPQVDFRRSCASPPIFFLVGSPSSSPVDQAPSSPSKFLTVSLLELFFTELGWIPLLCEFHALGLFFYAELVREVVPLATRTNSCSTLSSIFKFQQDSKNLGCSVFPPEFRSLSHLSLR